MNEDRVLAVDIEDAELQQRSVAGRPDQHCQLIVHDHAAYRGADGVQHVVVGDAVLSGWRAATHLDNVACLCAGVNAQARPLVGSPSPIGASPEHCFAVPETLATTDPRVRAFDRDRRPRRSPATSPTAP
jgi:hypothetical protein